MLIDFASWQVRNRTFFRNDLFNDWKRYIW